jgi:hypothetical protein
VTTQKLTRRQRHSYSPEVADLICERIAADGASQRQICQATNMPARSTVFVWLRQRPHFREKYTFAKRFQIQWLADEMIDIADDRTNDWTEREGPDGKKIRVFDNENFRSRKRQIGEVHWRISKLKPKRYYW